MSDKTRAARLAKAVVDLITLLVEADTLANMEENPKLTRDQARAIAERQTQEWLDRSD